MKKNLLLLFLSFLLNNILAQKLVLKKNSTICAIDTTLGASDEDIYTEKPNAETTKIVDNICKTMGVNPKSFILEAATVKKANALITEQNNIEQRKVLYSPLYFNKVKKETKSDWVIIFILAHEIGHHFNAHTLVGGTSGKEGEKEADAFAGCAMRRLGASQEDVENAMSFLKENDTKTHPPRKQRILSAIKGWEDCNAPPEGQKECEKKNTGNITFQNNTDARISVILINGDERLYNYRISIDLQPNEIQSFYNLPAKETKFLISKLMRYEDALFNVSEMFMDYKKVEYLIKTCTEKPVPILIK